MISELVQGLHPGWLVSKGLALKADLTSATKTFDDVAVVKNVNTMLMVFEVYISEVGLFEVTGNDERGIMVCSLES